MAKSIRALLTDTALTNASLGERDMSDFSAKSPLMGLLADMAWAVLPEEFERTVRANYLTMGPPADIE